MLANALETECIKVIWIHVHDSFMRVRPVASSWVPNFESKPSTSGCLTDHYDRSDHNANWHSSQMRAGGTEQCSRLSLPFLESRHPGERMDLFKAMASKQT